MYRDTPVLAGTRLGARAAPNGPLCGPIGDQKGARWGASCFFLGAPGTLSGPLEQRIKTCGFDAMLHGLLGPAFWCLVVPNRCQKGALEAIQALRVLSPLQGIKAVTPSVEARARQLVADRPQADRQNHSSVLIGSLIDR